MKRTNSKPNTKPKKGKLGNPAAVAVVSGIANTPQGQKTIEATTNAVKALLIIGGSVLVGKYAYSQYKKWRAERYANNNAGNPNLIAAAIIHNSFSRFEFPGYLRFILPSFNFSTNEDALYDIASKVTNSKAVSQAYKILFDRNLFFDVQEGLDTEELRTFWAIINSPQNNIETTLYPIGTELFVASRSGITVNKAFQNSNNQWEGTGDLFGNFKANESIGKVIAHGQVADGVGGDPNLVGQNYYIVEDCKFIGLFCNTGVVVQSQVRNSKL